MLKRWGFEDSADVMTVLTSQGQGKLKVPLFAMRMPGPESDSTLFRWVGPPLNKATSTNIVAFCRRVLSDQGRSNAQVSKPLNKASEL